MFWLTVIIVVGFTGPSLFVMWQSRLNKETEATFKRAAKIRRRTDRMRKRQEIDK